MSRNEWPAELGIEGTHYRKPWAEHVQRPRDTHIILKRGMVIEYSRSRVCLEGKVEGDASKKPLFSCSKML